MRDDEPSPMAAQVTERGNTREKYRSEVSGSEGTRREKAMSPDGLMKSDGRVLLEEVVFVSAAWETAARHDDTGTIVNYRHSGIESLDPAIDLCISLWFTYAKVPPGERSWKRYAL